MTFTTSSTLAFGNFGVGELNSDRRGRSLSTNWRSQRDPTPRAESSSSTYRPSSAPRHTNWRARCASPTSSLSRTSNVEVWRRTTSAPASLSSTSTNTSSSNSTNAPQASRRSTEKKLLDARVAHSPNRSELATRTEAYKVSEFRVRYWLVSQALKLERFQRSWEWMSGLDYHGHQMTLKWDLLFEIANEIVLTGVEVPASILSLLEKEVIDGRRFVTEVYFRSYKPTPDNETSMVQHEHHIKELTRMLSILSGRTTVKKKASLEEIQASKSWR